MAVKVVNSVCINNKYYSSFIYEIQSESCLQCLLIVELPDVLKLLKIS